MTRRIIISRNPFEPEAYEVHDDVEHVREFLMDQFKEWPDTARIYYREVSQLTDITPHDEHTINRLEEIDDDIFVIVYPEGPLALVLVLVLVVVAVVAVTALAKPKIPDVSQDQRNQQASSPNNELASRTNRARPNARIPDIYGTVRSTPDLIAQTYNYYENNRKVEIAYMCVGRGEFQIHDVRDAGTLLTQIAGSAAHFYLPNQSPKSGHAPFYSVGSAITDSLYRAKKLEQVVGQEMRPPNSASANNVGAMKYEYPDRIYNSNGYNLSDRFQAGDQVAITGATYTGASDTVSANAVARYVYNGGSEYIEWQSGDPRSSFQAGDSLIVSGAARNVTKSAFDETWTGAVAFYANGRIYFTGGDEPVEGGKDFRTNKDFVLSNASWTNDFSGTYNFATPPSNGDTRIYLADGSTTLASKNWNRVNTVTAYVTATVGGISRTVRFYPDGSVELQSGNWNDIVGNSSVTLAASCAITYTINGTYQFTSRNTGSDYWVLDNPSSVDTDWNAIRSGHEPTDASVTIAQTHSTDTFSFDPDGTYTISSVTATRIYVTASWSTLAQSDNDRTEYGPTDNFSVTTPTRSVNLNGTYTIVSVGLYEIILSNPALVNTDWNLLQYFPSDEVIPANTTIATTGGNWIGPYFIDNANCTRLISSFQAPQGLYTDDGTDQARKQVEVEMLVYPATSGGVGTGAAPQNRTLMLTGSAINRDVIAASMNFGLTTTGYSLIYARRITAKDTAFEGQVVDQVKWEEVYHLAPETMTHFGNITTVYTKTYATGGALALKERKLNCLVTRKIPIINGWTGSYPNLTPTYAADKAATRSAFQIFCAMTTDPFFGKRDISEVDTYNISQTLNQIYEYFGGTTYDVTEFCYTFDNTNISYEEAAQAIANAVFCTAYRQGSVIKWRPEMATQPPVLIFNHRNKLPDTETRTVRFGSQNDYDSIQLEWINPADDAVETFFIPEDQTGGKPKKIETIGIRNITQATFHAWRAFYKTKFQNVAVEFQSTQEAGVLVQKDRVLVADNTRADTQDGEIWDQDVLQLTLSQPVTLVTGRTYTMFIQHTDGSVEGIPITGVPDNLSIIKNVYLLKDGGVRFPVVADAGLFSAGDVVTLAGTSFVDPTNGSLNMDHAGYIVESANALTGEVWFSNALTLDSQWGQITEVDGHLRVGVNFSSERNNKRKVNLSYAPRLPLALDPGNYAKATYIIRSNVEVAPQEFIVQETRPRDNFTYQVSLVNYDARYYYLDDLEFWMNFDDQTFRDASARGHVPYISTASGKATIGFNSARSSYCYYNPTNSTAGWIKCDDLIGHRGSYTKAFWLRQGAGFDSYFLSNVYEQFRVNNNNRIIAGHDVGGVTALTSLTWPSSDGNWHHACCTYDADTKLLCVYIDGIKKAQKINVEPPSVGAALQIVGLNSSGVASPYADDVRYWRRAFSEAQVLDLYNATK